MQTPYLPPRRPNIQGGVAPASAWGADAARIAAREDEYAKRLTDDDMAAMYTSMLASDVQ